MLSDPPVTLLGAGDSTPAVSSCRLNVVEGAGDLEVCCGVAVVVVTADIAGDVSAMRLSW